MLNVIKCSMVARQLVLFCILLLEMYQAGLVIWEVLDLTGPSLATINRKKKRKSLGFRFFLLRLDEVIIIMP